MAKFADTYHKYIEPYADVLLFVVCLFGANFFWKYTVTGDEADTMVTWFGIDITAPFALLSEHIAHASYWLVSLLRDTVHLTEPNRIWFDSGFAVRIVWSCTPLKQSWIWLIIMLFARGSWLRKTWFIPLGWLVIHAFNILRISCINLLCEFHPDMFPLWHEYIFKYLFYGMMFLMWVWWVERLASLER